MTESAQPQEPLELLKAMWSSMGVPLPGMVTPTLDTNELDKRITDLKAVEGWLRNNLSMLQLTIQGLEMQRNTLAAMQGMSQAAGGAEANPAANPAVNPAVNPAANPFANPALWPWNMMQQATPAADPSPPAEKPKSS